jgi:hypothetical protein
MKYRIPGPGTTISGFADSKKKKIIIMPDLKRKIVKLIYYIVQGFKSASQIHEITVFTRTSGSWIRASNIWEYASPGLVRWSKIF